MDTYSKEFTLQQWPGRMFRVRSRAADWTLDVPSRMAVLEVVGRGTFEGIWQDFVTIREPEVGQVACALELVIPTIHIGKACPDCGGATDSNGACVAPCGS
jgi:protein involved in temperature-dependent protein secretion